MSSVGWVLFAPHLFLWVYFWKTRKCSTYPTLLRRLGSIRSSPVESLRTFTLPNVAFHNLRSPMTPVSSVDNCASFMKIVSGVVDRDVSASCQ